MVILLRHREKAYFLRLLQHQTVRKPYRQTTTQAATVLRTNPQSMLHLRSEIKINNNSPITPQLQCQVKRNSNPLV